MTVAKEFINITTSPLPLSERPFAETRFGRGGDEGEGAGHNHCRHWLHLIALAVVMIATVVWTGDSYAHVFPDHSDPKVGSMISAAPERVRIWFDGSLEPAFCRINVQDSSGKNVDKGDGRVNPSDATLLEAGVPRLSPGTYRVIWNVVARDGHRTAGDFSFVIK